VIRDKRLTVQILPERVSRFQHITKLIDDRATLGKDKRKKERKKRDKKGRLTERGGHRYTYWTSQPRQFCMLGT
jgi:CelD/BcsL family acetyltransferase involved in cellulose biosynthesis